MFRQRLPEQLADERRPTEDELAELQHIRVVAILTAIAQRASLERELRNLWGR